MPRNKVYAIVEGHGEADPPESDQLPAAAALVVKLLGDLGCWTLFPAKRPWRLASCGDFFANDKLEDVIRAHLNFQDCAAILVLVDMDDDCPGEEGPKLAERIGAMDDLPFSVVVVCAKCEYEAWFLASLETIQPGHTYPRDTEENRDAKGWLKQQFGYKEVRDQAQYTQAVDIELAWQRSRSFRRLYHAFEEVIDAYNHGGTVISPLSGAQGEAL
jgi:hypothetical protein